MTNLDKAREAARAHLSVPPGILTGATPAATVFDIDPWLVVYALSKGDEDAQFLLDVCGGLRLTCEGKPTVLISAAGEVTEET